MTYRGNLKQCANAALLHYGDPQWKNLSILCSDAGKYYTLISEEDYHKYHDKVANAACRLVFTGSMLELRNLVTSNQRDLFSESKDASHD